jgi:hypothetical protein
MSKMKWGHAIMIGDLEVSITIGYECGEPFVHYTSVFYRKMINVTWTHEDVELKEFGQRALDDFKATQVDAMNAAKRDWMMEAGA